jgi:PAS domain S-box-containing protein
LPSGGPERDLPSKTTLTSALFDSLPAAAFALSADGRVTAWNRAASRTFGWSADEVLGQRTPFASDAVREVLERVAAGEPGADVTLELAFAARDGSARRARLRSAPCAAGPGACGAVFVDAGGVDRTELERSDPFESTVLQRVLDAIPTPVWFKTTDGIYRGCNVAFEQALGKRRDQLIGRSVEATGPTRITSVYRSADEALFESGGTQTYEGELLRWDGSVRRVAFHKAAFRDSAGNVIGLAGALVDITDLRRTEEELRSALEEQRRAQEAARRADRLASLGTLAAGVAHELNNPLAYVLANAEWAVGQLERWPIAREVDGLVRALTDVIQGARRMKVIVSDLKSAARDETAIEAPAAIDLRRVVRFATQVAGAELRRRARLVIETEEVPAVSGSETRLGQVLVNLLVNAAHAMPDGDPRRNEIHVRVRRAADGRVAISVADNGSGIPDEARPHLFEPFFTTKPVGEGTGLGLWVCRGIVTAHGGEIEVESTVGVGTTFHVLLPAQEAGRQADAPSRRPETGAAPA